MKLMVDRWKSWAQNGKDFRVADYAELYKEQTDRSISKGRRKYRKQSPPEPVLEGLSISISCGYGQLTYLHSKLRV